MPVTQRTRFVPNLNPIRTALEVAGLVALALALWDARKQRDAVRRLIDSQIAHADGAMRRAARAWQDG